ncbi:hypothetical protein C8Q73DRAFT_416145 [Cubamyces lactineus]|nr:hypothetical protein C8Q73DRAFT_416145 [Cubamyces lactineus]
MPPLSRQTSQDDLQNRPPSQPLALVHAAWPTRTTIAKVPQDVLSHIFVALQRAASRNSEWLGILQVCRRWRDVALATPPIWRELVLDGWISPPIVDLVLSRSKRVKQLTLSGLGTDAFYLHTLIPILGKHGHCSETLLVEDVQGIHRSQLDVILRAGLPNLPQLVLKAPPHAHSSTMVVSADALRHLRLLTVAGTSIQIKGTLLGLERLLLINFGGDQKKKREPSIFRELLLSCPDVQQLLLHESIPEFTLMGSDDGTRSLIPLPPDLRSLQARDSAPEVLSFLSHAIISPTTFLTLSLDYTPPKDVSLLGGCNLEDLLNSSETLTDVIRSSGKAALYLNLRLSLVTLRGCAEPDASRLGWQILMKNGGPQWYDTTARRLFSMVASRLFAPCLRNLDIHFTTGSVVIGPMGWITLLNGLPTLSSFGVGGGECANIFLLALHEHTNTKASNPKSPDVRLILPNLQKLKLCFNDTGSVRVDRARSGIMRCIRKKGLPEFATLKILVSRYTVVTDEPSDLLEIGPQYRLQVSVERSKCTFCESSTSMVAYP